MKAYSVMLFLVCINISVYVLAFSDVFPVSGYPEGYTGPTSLTNLFKIENVDLTKIFVAGTGTILLGLAALLTKQYVFASVAILIWIIGIFLTPIGWVITGFPLLTKSIAEMAGAPSEVALMFQTVTSAFYAFIFFVFIMEIAGQRQIT